MDICWTQDRRIDSGQYEDSECLKNSLGFFAKSSSSKANFKGPFHAI